MSSFRIMEKWKWEVCKMFIYMSFPVACFHYFNSPQIFEESITKVKLQTSLPSPPERREKFEKLIREVNAERELRRLKELEAAYGM